MRNFCKRAALTIAVACLSVALSNGEGVEREHHVSTKLNIRHPKCLQQPDDGKTTHGYQHTDAMFGTPFEKDRMITGFMYYMTPNETAPGCAGYHVEIEADQSNANQVFLIDRGVCRFSLKVKVAQSAGAEAVVIGNNVCLQADYDLVKQLHGATVAASFCCDDILDHAGKVACQQYANAGKFPKYLPFMASSGLDTTVKIPAFLVTKVDARKIKEVLCDVQKKLRDRPEVNKYCMSLKTHPLGSCQTTSPMVIANMLLDTPHPDDRVEYEVWMKSDNPPEFLQSFEWFSQDLRKHTWFTPRYIVIKGKTYGCDHNQQACGELCIYDAAGMAYCVLPDSPGSSGQNVLEEDVRQYCIWEQENATFQEKGLPLWWAYMDQFNARTCARGTQSLESCSKSITDTLSGLDRTKYNACVGRKFDILKKLSDEQEEKGVFVSSMIVNTRVEHFAMTSERLAKIICDGYKDHTAPTVCKCIQQANTVNEFMLCKQCESAGTCDKVPGAATVSTGGMTFSSALGIVLITTTIVALGAFAYNKYNKRQMHDDVRNILAEYMPLDDVMDGPGESGRNGAPTSAGQSDQANLI